MKCQALHKLSLTRAVFEIEAAGEHGVRIVTPDGKEYWLIKERVLKALMMEKVIEVKDDRPDNQSSAD